MRAITTGILAALTALALVVPRTGWAGDAGGAEGGDLAPLARSLSAVGVAEAGERDGIELNVARARAVLTIEGRFRTPATSLAAWNVLTDYDSIERFVSSMRESRVVRRTSDSVWVEQEALGRMMMFRRKLHVRLRIHETRPTRIRFEDVLRRDFHTYRGEWRIEEGAAGTTVVYRLEADPSAAIPDFIARGLFRATAFDLLSQVRAEIERRAEIAAR